MGTNLVNGLELLCDCKDCLNVVVAQLLHQVSNGRIVLKKKRWRRKVTFTTHESEIFQNRSQLNFSTHIIVAHCVDAVLQVTFSVIWQHDAAQFTISSKVEASVSGEDQETSHVPPANQLLINQEEIHY